MQKKRGFRQLSFHVFEALALPNHVRTTTRSPRRNVCIFMHYMRHNILRLYRACTKHHRRTSIVVKSEHDLKFARFRKHQNKTLQ